MHGPAMFLLAAALAADPSVDLTPSGEGGVPAPLQGEGATVGQSLGEYGTVSELPSYLDGSLLFPVPPSTDGTLTLTCPAGATGTQTQSCETAFAMNPSSDGHVCFAELGFKRWGWTNVITGSTVLPVYSAAGQCDTSKGYQSATLEVQYISGVGIKVTYVPLPGNAITEIQVYVGKAELPAGKKGKPTVAPGQYPATFSDGTLSYTFGFEGVEEGEGFYLVAHAVICGAPQPACPCTFYLTGAVPDVNGCGPLITGTVGETEYQFRAVVERMVVQPGESQTVQVTSGEGAPILMGVYAEECGEGDVRTCPDGSTVTLDPENNCQFHDCPSAAPVDSE